MDSEVAPKKIWMSFNNLKDLKFYTTILNGVAVTTEASVMQMHDGKYRWNLRISGLNGLEETEELAEAKAVEELEKFNNKENK